MNTNVGSNFERRRKSSASPSNFEHETSEQQLLQRRKRCCGETNKSSGLSWQSVGTAVMFVGALLSHHPGVVVSAFTTMQSVSISVNKSSASTTSVKTTTLFHQRRASDTHSHHHRVIATVQPRKPLTKTSPERRKEAVKAMNRKRLESAFGPEVDAKMLELLASDKYLYSNAAAIRNNINGEGGFDTTLKQQLEHTRPKGRPEFVPGAMTQETMIKYRERKEVLQMLNKRQINAIASEAELSAIAPYILDELNGKSDVVENSSNDVTFKTTRDRITNLKGSSPANNNYNNNAVAVADALPTVPDTSTSKPSKRKRVVKNLPASKTNSNNNNINENDDNDNNNESTFGGVEAYAKSKPKGSYNNGMNLHKYYRTDLLTSDEEYSLGMKIQFMSKCEHVHEGLAAHLNRLPTMVEWAAACGFTEADDTFVATEADELLRPAGAEQLFQETDPSMFVGNGLATEAGPGRGRGRAKKTPPLQLKDFYDDSEYRYQQKHKKSLKKEGVTLIKKSDLQPINRGTATHFVELMMTARQAKQRMVQSNMRLVVSIARKYSNVGVSLQDLVQEGSLGLSRAADKFEPKKGFKFSTYASWWIQQAVFRSIAYHSRTIRLPVHVHNLLNRVRKVRQALQSDLGRPPTNEEIAEQLGMPLAKYNKMIRLTKRSISLESPKYQSNPKDLGHESDDLLGDTISSTTLEDESTPERSVDHGLFHEDLKDMMEILNEDERRVICARYGLQDGLTRTVTTVAAQLGESKAWVRSLECRALRKLRRPWYEKKLKEHQDALAE